MSEENQNKPVLQVVGTDGNAFALLGKARQVMRQEKWSKEKRDEVMEKAMSGDYNHLLRILMEYFDVQ